MAESFRSGSCGSSLYAASLCNLGQCFGGFVEGRSRQYGALCVLKTGWGSAWADVRWVSTLGLDLVGSYGDEILSKGI